MTHVMIEISYSPVDVIHRVDQYFVFCTSIEDNAIHKKIPIRVFSAHLLYVTHPRSYTMISFVNVEVLATKLAKVRIGYQRLFEAIIRRFPMRVIPNRIIVLDQPLLPVLAVWGNIEYTVALSVALDKLVSHFTNVGFDNGTNLGVT